MERFTGSGSELEILFKSGNNTFLQTKDGNVVHVDEKGEGWVMTKQEFSDLVQRAKAKSKNITEVPTQAPVLG